MRQQYIKLLPYTRFGIITLILLILMPVLFLIGSSFTNTMYKSIPAGDTIIEDIVKRPVLAITMLSGIIDGILLFIIGTLTIIYKRDHSLLVIISTIIGLLFTIMIICEIT